MKRWIVVGLSAAALTGCVAYEPAPYYGGAAPYYGTAYAPAYVGVYEGAYYPYYTRHRIYSGYHNGYWHYQHGHSQPRGHQGAQHGDGGHWHH
jgi:hypothetical protein